jgi:hypothetical protein
MVTINVEDNHSSGKLWHQRRSDQANAGREPRRQAISLCSQHQQRKSRKWSFLQNREVGEK